MPSTQALNKSMKCYQKCLQHKPALLGGPMNKNPKKSIWANMQTMLLTSGRMFT